MSDRCPSAGRGFTLLEALVALLVLALLAAGAQALLATGARVGERQSEWRLAREEELRLDRLFRERLAGALAWRTASGEEPRLLFEGDGTRLRLLLVEDPRLLVSALAALELVVVEADGWSQLRLREAGVEDATDPFAGLAAVPAQLFARLPGRWRFAYLQAEEGEAPRWREEWRERAQLPLAVRLAAADRQALPFLAHLRYAASCARGRKGPPCGPGEVP